MYLIQRHKLGNLYVSAKICLTINKEFTNNEGGYQFAIPRIIIDNNWN